VLGGKRPRLQIISIIIMAAVLAGTVIYRVRGFGMNTRYRESLAMDTLVSVSVSSNKTPSETERILDGVFSLIDDLNKKLSMHNVSSDISRVNAGSGVISVRVAPETAKVLESALALAALTGGAFDPTIGPITALWRVNYREEPREALPSEPEITLALDLVDYRMVSILSPDKIFLVKRGMALDLGGIAKGYVSGAVMNFLKESGIKSAMIDLGGNLAVLGSRPDGELWRVGVQHPLRPRGEPICSVAVHDSSVITAGVYERFIEIGGKTYTHIFDPFTGSPVDGGLLSATVVTEDPTKGDALSTAFMVMGEAGARRLLNELPGVEAIFVSAGPDGRLDVTATDGLNDSLVMIDDETRR
jgi:thiamine biosynthesis lipoprotein